MAYSEKDRAALIEWIDRKRRADWADRLLEPLTPEEKAKTIPEADPDMVIKQSLSNRDPYNRVKESQARRALLKADDEEIRQSANIVCVAIPWPENLHSPLTRKEIKMIQKQEAPWIAAMARLVEIAEQMESEK